MGRKARLKRERRRQRERAKLPADYAVAFEFHMAERARWTMRLDTPPGLVTPDTALPLLLDALPGVREAMLRAGVIRSSCICSTKVVCTLAQAFGLKARPLSVRVQITNKIATDALKRAGWDARKVDVGSLAAQGGRLLAAGDDLNPDAGDTLDHWDGHLVALVTSRQGTKLIDLSFDQFHRPHKDIPITGPMVAPVSDPNRVDVTAERGDGVTTMYGPRDNDRWLDSPDWRRRYVLTLNGVEHILESDDRTGQTDRQ